MARLKIVLTGASAGIGAALTRALASDGHQLFVCARRSDRLAQVTANGTIATAIACDASKAGDVVKFADVVRNATGSIDALINCAGLYGPIGLAIDADIDAWWDAVAINLRSIFLTTKHFVPLMTRRHARIINFAGGGAFQPLPRYSAYAVSKAAIVRFTETLASELSDRGITVNAVAPGFVATEIHDATLAAGPDAAGAEFYAMTRDKLRSGAVPVEVPINLVRYLLSPKAAGLTGKTLSANFDPWPSEVFSDSIDELNRSPLYTMQRVNLIHLPPDDELRAKLENQQALARGPNTGTGNQ